MVCPSLSRAALAAVFGAMFASLASVGCAQQRPGVQTGAVTPPVVDLSPQAADADVPASADDAPALNPADLSPKPASAAPPADIADLDEAADGDGDNGAVKLPRQSPDGVQPIADAQRASPPPLPELPRDADSAEGTEDSVAEQPGQFRPPLKTVEQRLAELEQRLELHKQAILEMGDVSLLDERLNKMENDLADLRSSFNNVAKLVTEDPSPASEPDSSQLRTPPKQTSQQLGLLVIENHTGLAYPMTVNGYRFQIVPGRHQFKVPIGEVVTELNGFEDAKTWQAGDWRDVDGQQQLAIQIR